MPFQPSPGDILVSRPLSNLSVAYIQDQMVYVASKFAPAVAVRLQGGKYFIYNKQDWNRIEARKRAAGSESAGSGWRLTQNGVYFCEKYSVHKDNVAEDYANAEAPINVDQDATEWVTQQLLLLRERIFAETYFDTGIWGKDWVGTVDFTQWDDASSNPVDDVEQAKDYIRKLTGKEPNTLVVGSTVHSRLKSNAEILDRMKITQDKVVTPALLAAMFEIDNYLVAKAVVDTANEGGTEAMDYVLNPKDALLAYIESSPGIKKPSAAYTFSWTGLVGAGGIDRVQVKRFYDQKIDATRIEGTQAYDMRVVASDLGLYFDAAVA